MSAKPWRNSVMSGFTSGRGKRMCQGRRCRHISGYAQYEPWKSGPSARPVPAIAPPGHFATPSSVKAATFRKPIFSSESWSRLDCRPPKSQMPLQQVLRTPHWPTIWSLPALSRSRQARHSFSMKDGSAWQAMSATGLSRQTSASCWTLRRDNCPGASTMLRLLASAPASALGTNFGKSESVLLPMNRCTRQEARHCCLWPSSCDTIRRPLVETSSRFPMPRRKKYPWEKLSDEQLLKRRLSSLRVTVEGTWLEDCLNALYQELQEKGIQLRPHAWISSEWFSPGNVPGIAIPFYLAHPRLMKLEKKMMLDVEGGTWSECMAILRHEAGHAIQMSGRTRRALSFVGDIYHAELRDRHDPIDHSCAGERGLQPFEQLRGILRLKNDPDHQLVGMPLDLFGRCLQPHVGAVAGDIGGRKAGGDVALFAEIVEQLLAQRSRRNQSEADELGAHLASLMAFASLAPPPNRR